jgi:hypothetical protein
MRLLNYIIVAGHVTVLLTDMLSVSTTNQQAFCIPWITGHIPRPITDLYSEIKFWLWQCGWMSLFSSRSSQRRRTDPLKNIRLHHFPLVKPRVKLLHSSNQVECNRRFILCNRINSSSQDTNAVQPLAGIGKQVTARLPVTKLLPRSKPISWVYDISLYASAITFISPQTELNLFVGSLTPLYQPNMLVSLKRIKRYLRAAYFKRMWWGSDKEEEIKTTVHCQSLSPCPMTDSLFINFWRWMEVINLLKPSGNFTYHQV